MAETLGDKRRHLSRARWAAEALEDAEIWARLEEKFRQEWLRSDDVSRQTAARAKTLALADIKQELRHLVGQGEHARKVIEEG